VATGTPGRLRLKAEDAHDLAVIAACLQDARVPLKEMAYQPAERRFLACFNRYRRERQADPASCEGLTEVLSTLAVERIAEVRHRGIDVADPDHDLVLLTIATEPAKGERLHIDLVFEGDARIRLTADAIAARLDDFGEPTPCTVTPCDHEACTLPGWLESYDYKA
jgi:hypothetical protein